MENGDVEQADGDPDYGNWVSKKLLYLIGAIGVLLLASSIIQPLLFIAAIFFLLALTYFAYARYEFSSRGGNVQTRIRELLLDNLEWDGQGRAIDIGCGNAPVTIMMAKKYPKSHVAGIDYWGGMWEYSKGVCERNARIEGVAERVSFQKASASALPFDDGHFDAAVSNLVFHEVKDAKDKRDAIRESLRVVKKGGKFAFQDTFLDKRLYGDVEDLKATIRSWGVQNVEFLDTSHSDFIPKALRLRFMVGAMGILYGTR